MMLRQPGPVAARLTGKLKDIANQLQVPRIGEEHQAGSDSLTVGRTTLQRRFKDTSTVLVLKLLLLSVFRRDFCWFCFSVSSLECVYLLILEKELLTLVF
uniref:Uncharacterized protein n=1 Tax=Ditylenchus dipsaci TaxID=166011 RepID=A0A915EK99_9BILA